MVRPIETCRNMKQLLVLFFLVPPAAEQPKERNQERNSFAEYCLLQLQPVTCCCARDSSRLTVGTCTQAYYSHAILQCKCRCSQLYFIHIHPDMYVYLFNFFTARACVFLGSSILKHGYPLDSQDLIEWESKIHHAIGMHAMTRHGLVW